MTSETSKHTEADADAPPYAETPPAKLNEGKKDKSGKKDKKAKKDKSAKNAGDDAAENTKADAPKVEKPKAAPKKTATDAALDGLAVGRVVHFVVPKGVTREAGPVCRAAIVSKVYEGDQVEAGTVDLHALVCRDDYPEDIHPGWVLYVERVPFSATGEDDGTWHWPEKV